MTSPSSKAVPIMNRCKSLSVTTILLSYLLLISNPIDTAASTERFICNHKLSHFQTVRRTPSKFLHLRGGSLTDPLDALPSASSLVTTDASLSASASAPVAETSMAPSTPTAVEATVSKQPSPSPSKLSNAIERTGPAVLLLTLVSILIRYAGEKGLIGLVLLLQVGMYAEPTDIITSFHNKGPAGIADVLDKWWWFATVVTATSLRHILGASPLIDLISFGMVSVGLVSSVARMAIDPNAGTDFFREYVGKMAGFNFALFFLVGQSSFWIKTIKSFGIEWVLYPALLVVVNDTMAYVFGMLMGKHKLLPRLSPKKTVEGFVGAGLSTLLVSIPLLKLVLKHSVEGGKAMSVFGNALAADGGLVTHALVMAAYASLVAPFGGFLASAVKRAHGAKDFGTLIPGHGGVVDRFDCQIVTAPFVFLYLKHCLDS